MAYMYLGEGAEPEASGTAPAGRIGTLINWTGALMSVALIAGLTVWAYQLAMRDVSGVPVVRALEGPMRMQPEDPGGEQAAHQGLAVNSVAAEGTAAPPADRLVLAPPPLDLADEDLPLADLVAGNAPADDATPETATPGAPPREADADADPAPETPPEPEIQPIPASADGIVRSPRPVPRPAGSLDNVVPLSAETAPALDVDPATLPEGTRLVQFGAYDSPTAARGEWDRLDARFTDFLAEKKRVIQRAEAGGKILYRLRAMGFEDINAARRFCTAFLAERQPCIPVVTR